MYFQGNEDLHCTSCDFKCRQQSILESHMRNHSRDKPLFCDQCNRGFSCKSNLRRHIRSVHQGIKIAHEKKYKCSLCPYATYHQHTWKTHIQVHTGERGFPCPHPSCQYAGKTSAALQAHNTRKHKLESKILCTFPNCGYRGKTLKDLRGHSSTHSDNRPFVCNLEGCMYRAKKKQTLSIHKLRAHTHGYKPFACSICKYCTTTSYDLKRHERTHSAERTFKCSFIGCAKYSKTKRNLTIHVLNCHTAKVFKCDVEGCPSTTASLLMLKEHKKRVHYGKNYKCPHCDHRAACPSKLQKHVVIHNGSQRIPCPTKGCSLKSKNLVSLREHMRRHKANFDCSVKGCDYVGYSSFRLKLHMKLHDPTGRPFHCPLCPRYFPSNSALSIHLVRIHTREKPFQCPACDFGALHKPNIIKHVRAFHPTVSSALDEESTWDRCNLNFSSNVDLATHRIKLKTAVVVLTRLQLK